MPQQLGEFERISRFFRDLTGGSDVALCLGDDAAQWTPPAGRRVVMTVDTMVEGRHYLPGTDPMTLGWKLAAVNLSDLAGCGADPAGMLLSLALPRSAGEDWLAGFTAGLADSRAAYGWDLWGGDSVATEGPPVLGLTAIGTVPSSGMILRSGAKPGDAVLVSGTVGDAALGLLAKRDGAVDAAAAPLVDRYDRPTPRIALGSGLREIASAGMDISDGLFGDAAHIARASGVTLEIETAALPLSPAARAFAADRPDRLETALAGGDDYELLLTVPGDRVAAAERVAASLGISLTQVGRCIPAQDNRPVVALARGRERATPTGWTHF